MQDHDKVTRREFIAATVAAGACMCGLDGCFIFPNVGNTPQIFPPAYEIASLDKNVEIIVDTGQTPDLLNEGGAVKIIDSNINDSIIIANTGRNVFAALSIACTHNGFEVEYKHDRKVFRCISVNHAEFSCDGGHVLDGPTEKRLTGYLIRHDNEKLIVTFAA